MARAVNPRLGDDGYGDDPLPDPKICAQEVEPLLVHLGASSKESLASLTQALAEIELQYFKGAKRGADGISRASAGAALDHILKMPTITIDEVRLLNERALDAIVNELMILKGIWKKGDSVVEKLFAGKIAPEILRSACVASRTRLTNTDGPDKDFALSFCVSQLCKLYETVTNTRITLSNKGEHLAYVGAPCSAGGTFVFEALKLIVRPADAHAKDAMGRAASRYIRGWINQRRRPKAVQTSRTGSRS